MKIFFPGDSTAANTKKGIVYHIRCGLMVRIQQETPAKL